MIRIVMIRHGKTLGNIRKAYIGSTDETIVKELIKNVDKKKYLLIEKVFSSPLKRCLETAEILYDGIELEIKPDLRECDFGDFEGKTYEDLKDNKEYIEWIGNSSQKEIPNGESREKFEKRCQICFENIVNDCKENKIKKIAIICHGGTIMSIFHKFVTGSENFYQWQVNNLGGYEFSYDSREKKIIDIKIIES